MRGPAQAEARWFSGPAILLPLAALADPALKVRTKLVLAAIASHAGPDGITPAIGKKAIAASAGLPPTNLARELRELVDGGWLEVRRQPGTNSIYRLRIPRGRDGGAEARAEPGSAQMPAEQRLSDAPVVTRKATVAMVTRHGNSWHVAFTLEDGSRVGTIFTECDRPCEPGETAYLKVREWKGRKGIAGGAADGIEWIVHKPVPPPIVAKSFDLAVSDLKRFGTPAGLIYASFSAAGDGITASAMLAEQQLPAGLADGARIRVARADGAAMTVWRSEPHLDIGGNGYAIELLAN